MSKRLPIEPPRQTKISVQDIRDASTLQGTAMLNDELKRIQLHAEGLQNKLANLADDLAAVKAKSPIGKEDEGGGVPDDMKKAIWALTTEHNDRIITARTVQDLDFTDTGEANIKYQIAVKWNLTSAILEEALRTIPDGKKTVIKAWAYANPEKFLRWLDLCIRPIMSVYGFPSTTPFYNYYIHLVNDEEEPGGNKVYGTNGLGVKGWVDKATVIGNGKLELGFSYDILPVGSSSLYIGAIPANSYVFLVVVKIATAFNQTTLIRIGDTGSQTRLMESTNSLAVQVNQYHNSPNYKYTADTDLRAYFFCQDVSAQGQGTIIIYYS